ncbi:hypothetical protein LEP1GSC008_1847 [Leptospira kirschneri serovar Bulgarica str. Nikolaevo]|uniref:Uncharacterized protein n=1 Tax=Leptospira kirschneri serovar Bulgarica str. Nikolaevo TaxID=1240687 RepID=M6FAC1_9LEPT|nr:hypothetical protein LEP1GSC008_1847 [Leptospira kirschneri serovar Bulgarica str. Nikolaevo]
MILNVSCSTMDNSISFESSVSFFKDKLIQTKLLSNLK